MLIFKNLSGLLKKIPRKTNGELRSPTKTLNLMLLRLLLLESELVRKKMSKSKMVLSNSETKSTMKVSFVIGLLFTQVILEVVVKETKMDLILPMILLTNSDNAVNN
jgi:hypothetical protein